MLNGGMQLRRTMKIREENWKKKKRKVRITLI
jgi:hypothetical protein